MKPGVRLRFINGALGLAILLLLATGIISLFVSRGDWAAVWELHRIAGAGLLILLGFKLGIITGSLRRRWRRPSATLVLSLTLGALLLLVLGLALAWTLRIGPPEGLAGFSTIGLHFYLALVLVPFLLYHVWQRWPHPRARDFVGRRQALIYLGGLGIGLAGWQALNALAASPRRRFTGSLESNSFQGNAMPITSNVTEAPPPIDRAAWQLAVRGRVSQELGLRYDELAAPANRQDQVALLDCTSGWYSRQEWRGIPVAALLDRAGLQGNATQVTFRAVTGYGWSFPLEEARGMLLATHIGPEPLAHGHGAPLRLVAPERRGYQWVKWLVAVEVG